jgi:alpha-1,2-mannosyltransferase
MGGLVEALRSGSFLTRERMRLVAVAVIVAFAVGYGWLAATSHGLVDFKGRPIGTDFSSFYAAGTLVLDGQPQAVFDPALHFAREQALFGTDTPFYSFLYPPFFLVIAAALALLPYGAALAAWQGTTFLLYLGSMRAILATAGRTNGLAHVPEKWTPVFRTRTCANAKMAMLLAAGFPAVFVNLGHGQNGFLTAALIGAALALLERRPLTAGLLIGLLAYKPQFGLMIPLALVAGGHWRAVAAATATVALLVAATWLAFGTAVWDAFLASTQFTRTVLLEAGDVGWFKIQSVFAWTRMWGGSIGLAYGAQALVTVAAGVALVWLWRGAAPYRLKAGGLCVAMLLATPFGLDYDMIVLAPAIAFVAADGLERGFRPWEKSTLAGLWLVPLIARGIAEQTLLPLGTVMMIAGFLMVLRRAASEGHFLSTPRNFDDEFLRSREIRA